MEEQVHPKSGKRILGSRLGPGTRLTKNDVYDSTSGAWEKCTCPDTFLGKTETIWVRPFTVPSPNAQQLLAYLTGWGEDSPCVAQASAGGFVVIPSKDFNWDGRVDTPPVKNPECVHELVECGCLAYVEHAMRGTGGFGGVNRIYEVTSAARRYADVHLHKRVKG